MVLGMLNCFLTLLSGRDKLVVFCEMLHFGESAVLELHS